MLFPEDPKLRPSLWSSLTTCLLSGPHCQVVVCGVGHAWADARLGADEDVAATVARLRTADFCRISASRGTALAPHFALHLSGPGRAALRELIVLPSEDSSKAAADRLRGHLETVAVCVFHGCPRVGQIVVPMAIEPWPMHGATITRAEDGLLIER